MGNKNLCERKTNGALPVSFATPPAFKIQIPFLFNSKKQQLGLDSSRCFGNFGPFKVQHKRQKYPAPQSTSKYWHKRQYSCLFSRKKGKRKSFAASSCFYQAVCTVEARWHFWREGFRRRQSAGMWWHIWKAEGAQLKWRINPRQMLHWKTRVHHWPGVKESDCSRIVLTSFVSQWCSSRILQRLQTEKKRIARCCLLFQVSTQRDKLICLFCAQFLTKRKNKRAFLRWGCGAMLKSSDHHNQRLLRKQKFNCWS